MASTPGERGNRASPGYTRNARSGERSAAAEWNPRDNRGAAPRFTSIAQGRGRPGSSSTRSHSAPCEVR